MDLSSLINIRDGGHLHRLDRLAQNTLIKLTSGIINEIMQGNADDNITSWVRINQPWIEHELEDEEKQRLKEVIERYGVPFRHQGQFRKALTSEDAEAVAVASVRGWVLVTDDSSMRIVCNEIYGATCMSTGEFLKLA